MMDLIEEDGRIVELIRRLKRNPKKVTPEEIIALFEDCIRHIEFLESDIEALECSGNDLEVEELEHSNNTLMCENEALMARCEMLEDKVEDLRETIAELEYNLVAAQS